MTGHHGSREGWSPAERSLALGRRETAAVPLARLSRPAAMWFAGQSWGKPSYGPGGRLRLSWYSAATAAGIQPLSQW